MFLIPFKNVSKIMICTAHKIFVSTFYINARLSNIQLDKDEVCDFRRKLLSVQERKKK